MSLSRQQSCDDIACIHWLVLFNGLIGELIRKNGKINLIFIERSNGSNSGAKKDIIFSEFKFNLQKSPREYF